MDEKIVPLETDLFEMEFLMKTVERDLDLAQKNLRLAQQYCRRQRAALVQQHNPAEDQ
jgi:hypothetical protein